MKFSLKGIALASAILWGTAVLIVGLINLMLPTYGAAFLSLVSSIYPGYHAGTGMGSVIIGTLYAILDGAVGGFLFGWLYNHFATCCEKECG